MELETLIKSPSAVSAFLSSINTAVNWILEIFIPNIVNRIVADPLLLFSVGFLAIGGVIGIMGRLLSRD